MQSLPLESSRPRTQLALKRMVPVPGTQAGSLVPGEFKGTMAGFSPAFSVVCARTRSRRLAWDKADKDTAH